jgi:putative transposase
MFQGQTLVTTRLKVAVFAYPPNPDCRRSRAAACLSPRDPVVYEVVQGGATLASDTGVPRRRRCFVPGVSCHVTQRGNNHSLIFRAPSDCDIFAVMLRHACRSHGVAIHAYALMTNHIHLLATPEKPTALPCAMQALGLRYVQYFNRRYRRSGGLWDGRYRSALVHDERYWMTCMRYVELNPVRAGMVASPEDHRWSSYANHAFGKTDRLVTDHPLYLALGRTSRLRELAWREICGQQMTPEELEHIRRSIRSGIVLSEPANQEAAAG